MSTAPDLRLRAPATIGASRTAALVDELRAIVGDSHVLAEPGDIASYCTDWLEKTVGSAACVVRPASTGEVATIVRACAQRRIPIVPQGGNTGLMGGATPRSRDEAVVLSLGRMNRILSVDPRGSTMKVEAGALLQAVREAADAAGRLFPLSIGAQGSCTIGGNVSTNAGGAQALRYGTMRHLVLGLEAVLPDGRVWDGLKSLKKDNTGYDLRQLFIGAEGTLGIVTRVVLRLVPKPQDIATAWIAVPDLEAAVDLLDRAQQASDEAVTTCEVLSRGAVEGALRHLPSARDPLASPAEWAVLMVWSSGRRADGDGLSGRFAAFLSGMLEEGRVLDAALAQTGAQEREMWLIREGQADAIRKSGPSVSFDMSVAVSAIPRFVAEADAAVRKVLPGIRPVHLGHIGDGNLHYTLLAPVGMSDPDWSGHLPLIHRTVDDLIAAIGGSISAEHGIGQAKIDDLERYGDPTGLEIMRQIKRALDPHGLMNPGKVLRS